MSAEPETPTPATAEGTAVDPAAAAPSPTAAGAAPEIAEPEAPLEPKDMDRYECRSCGYDYVPTKGDDRGRIAAGTAFEDLPDRWKCPVCGAPKNQFSNIGPLGSPSGFKENLGYGLGVNKMTPSQKNILIFGSLALAFFFFLSLYGLR